MLSNSTLDERGVSHETRCLVGEVLNDDKICRGKKEDEIVKIHDVVHRE